MSLATRCSSCGTVFRVVQDQLKVSEGWVRCGRCNEVFNALEGLFDLGRDLPSERDEKRAAEPAVPPSAGTDSPGAEASDPAASAAGGPIFGIPPSPIDGLLADPIDAHLFRKRGAEGDRSPAVQVDARDRLEFSDARFDSDLFAENPALDTTLVEVLSTGAGDLPLESESQQPDFLRRADRRARWRSAPARLALVFLSALAGLMLAAQIGHHFRDAFVAQWPAARPLLTAWCRAAGCTLEAPRRIDDVSVESTALTRATGVDAFVLSVMLRSRGHLALTTPSIDLSLTDGNGRLVARRALSPRDFGVASVLQPGVDTAMQVMLGVGNYRVAGYTVEVFYP
jgi:predicted Zn finger-like uncharacterized protein